MNSSGLNIRTLGVTQELLMLLLTQINRLEWNICDSLYVIKCLLAGRILNTYKSLKFYLYLYSFNLISKYLLLYRLLPMSSTEN
jgi:hypothetical protein